MKLDKLFQSLLLTGAVIVFISAPARSEEVREDTQAKSSTATTGKSTSNDTVAVTDQEFIGSKSPLLTLSNRTTRHFPSIVANSLRKAKAQNIAQLNQIEQVSQSAELLVQSPAAEVAPSSEVVPVTGVQANATENGVEIILQTTLGEQLQITNRSAGNNFIADIPNAQLLLPSGDAFTFTSPNPVEGITEITVTNFDANTIRVTVAGETGLPNVELFDSDEGLILGLTPATTAMHPPQQPEPEEPESETPEEEPLTQDDQPIELVVTGEQSGYRVREGSTATRTDTPLRDIPANIQVIPRQVLEDQGAVRLDEALRNIAGVTFSSSFGNRGQDFRVRGFSATQYRNGLREDVGGSGSFNNRTAQETADIERIEVLKGPASVLFGQGEPGGVINLVTKKPLSTPYYNIGFTAGSFDFYRPTLDFSGPLNDDGSLAYRLNIAYESAGSFRDFTDSRRYFIAPSLAWTISPSTKLTLEASYLQDRRTFDRGLIVLNGSDRPANLPFNRALFDPNFSKTNIEETRAYLYLDHNFSDDLSLRSAFRYTTSFESDREGSSSINRLLGDNRTVEIGASFGDQFFETYTFQNDLVWKFNTGAIAHTLLLGVEIRNASARFSSQAPDEQQNLFGGLLDIFEPNYSAIAYTGGFQVFEEGDFQDQRTVGVYLQDQITLADNLKLLIGGRFDNVNFEQEFQVEEFSQEQSDSAFSPRLGLVYQPSETLSLYASYSRSFVPVLGRSATNAQFRPTRGTQYEIGAKADFLDGRLSTTLSAYNITRSNVLTPDPDPANSGFSVQVGEQRGRGIDLDVAGEILPGWNIIASYALLDATITQDNRFEVGNRLNNIPNNAASLWTTYTVQSGDLRGLGFGAGAFFVGERTGDLANSFMLPGYTRFDAAVYYNRDNFRAALNLKNLFGTEYFAGSQNRSAVVPGAPFEVQGTISWQF
ncbi:TonB-dependent siderophore receptor [Nostocales cyanobacterium LEGE 11386]|nr:TonB-dependent siderophore receptor [Nostocales cyanobacterium LEGE 11386]